MSGAQGLLIPELGPILEFKGEHRFLSNFWMEPVAPHGPWWMPEVEAGFASVEHAFQAAKVEPATPGAVEHYRRIAEAGQPGEAKRLGGGKAFAEREVTLRSGWDTIKVPVMLACLRAKFAPGSQLAGQLASTTPRVLVEGNTWGDRFWGVDGTGSNLLGKCLMLVRQELIVCRSTALYPHELWGPR